MRHQLLGEPQAQRRIRIGQHGQDQFLILMLFTLAMKRLLNVKIGQIPDQGNMFLAACQAL